MPTPEDTLKRIEMDAKSVGLDEKTTAEIVSRCKAGFEVYGPENHLKPEFDVVAELREELMDALALCSMFAVRDEWPRQMPHVDAYMLSNISGCLKTLKMFPREEAS